MKPTDKSKKNHPQEWVEVRNAKRAPRPKLTPDDSASSLSSNGSPRPKCTFVNEFTKWTGCRANEHPTHWRFEDGVATHKDCPAVWATFLPGHKAKGLCEQAVFEFMWKRPGHRTLSSLFPVAGSYTKGISGMRDDGERIKEVVMLPYALSPAEFAEVTKDFPGYHFVCGEERHDHPVAHTRTKLNSDTLFAALPKGTVDNPKLYLDMHGNPEANRKANLRDATRRIDTVVERVTAKDYLRAAEKWGNWEERKGTDVFEHTDRDWMCADGSAVELKKRTGDYVGYISIHTLYYYERRFLAELLARKKGSVLYALVHRFPDIKGTLNNKEQTYEKFAVNSEHGYDVRQTNVLTGEAYVNPDTEWLFQNTAWTDGTNGLAWTLNKASTDSYFVKMTWCPPTAAVMTCGAIKPAKKRDNVREALFTEGCVPVSVGGTTITIEVDAPMAFQEMRGLVSGKARTAAQFKEHLASTKRKMKNHGEEGASANKTALASFLVDFDNDRELTVATLGASVEAARELRNALEGCAPLSARNVLDKVLAFGVLSTAFIKGQDAKTAASFLRTAREMVQSDGTKVSV